MIDFSTLQGLTIPEGAVTQITDAAGNVLWSSTIKFTINGDTYIADRGMTWAEWFASAYNTTGKTADDVQSISANGASVALNAVIVGGTAYEMGFAPATAILTLIINGAYNLSNAGVIIDGVMYRSAGTVEFEIPIGETIRLCINYTYDGSIIIFHSDNTQERVALTSTSPITDNYVTYNRYYDYTVIGNATIRAFDYDEYDPSVGGRYYYGTITVQET